MRIMVINTTPEGYGSMKQTLAEQTRFIQETYASPGTEIICVYPEKLVGGGAIHLKQMKAGSVCGFSHHLLAPAIIKKALEAEEEGFDAVVQINNYDPGMEGARFVLRIPVVGVGRTSCAMAATLADRIGIIVPYDSSIPNAYRMIRSYGFADFISSIVAANPPAPKDKSVEEVLHCFELAGKRCLQEGAQIIVPLCGVFIPLTFSAAVLSEKVGIQVVDTLAIGIGLAELFVRFGLSHSEKAYPSFVKILSSEISTGNN